MSLWRFRYDEASVTWQGEEGVFQDPGGWSAGAGSFIQRPRSSSARKEVLSGATLHATTLDLYFTLWSEPESLKGMLKDLIKRFSEVTAHTREHKGPIIHTWAVLYIEKLELNIKMIPASVLCYSFLLATMMSSQFLMTTSVGEPSWKLTDPSESQMLPAQFLCGGRKSSNCP